MCVIKIFCLVVASYPRPSTATLQLIWESSPLIMYLHSAQKKAICAYIVIFCATLIVVSKSSSDLRNRDICSIFDLKDHPLDVDMNVIVQLISSSGSWEFVMTVGWGASNKFGPHPHAWFTF